MGIGPLHGIRVLDASRALAGPLATMVLGDLGADVIKVEVPKVGDDTRYWGPPFIADAGPTFLGYNRNKRSIALDLRSAEDRETFLELARSSDVLVENFRPGTMERFELGYPALSEAVPKIIYCSISGYGQTGPSAARPAMDLLVQASSGLMSLTGDPKGEPHKAAAPVADVMGALSAVVAILGALRERDRSGKGRRLDISMLDGMLTLLGQSITTYSMSGNPPRRIGNEHALMAPYQSYSATDRDIILAVTNEKTWQQLCRVPEFAHLAENPDFALAPDRNHNRAVLNAEIAGIIATRPAEHWMCAFDVVGVPAEPVNTIPEVLDSEHIRQRGSIVEIEYPEGSGRYVRIPGLPWRDVAAAGPLRSPPTLGQHTQEILTELNRSRKDDD